MSNTLLFLELFLVHGLVLGWAFWEYRKTSKLVDETRAREAALKEADAASETVTSL